VSIGVALANEPAVLLADEPTGELDTSTGEEVFAALRTANTDLGVTILVVTHDQQVSEQVRRTIAIRDGRISTEVLRHTQTDAEGQEADVAQEYAVLDRAGRLQIPRDFIETLEMRDRVLLALESDHVGVWPDAVDRGERPGLHHRRHGRHERDGGTPTPDSASPNPASPDSASPDPASPHSASPDPATPHSASPDPASPPHQQEGA
jgi:putative ABC transport system ATP-binding protein